MIVRSVWGTILIVLSGLLAPVSWAGDYSGRAELDEVVASVAAQGVDPDWALEVLEAATRQQSILDAIARPAEKTKPWHEYRKIFLTQQRITEGAAFWDAHAPVLAEVAAQTGVPAAVIVSIIGVETYYGRITGSYRVIDALSTLAFDYPKRAPFFRSELQHFLILTWESGKPPLALKGSYAGAMGYGQFMPSSYRNYARSFDQVSAPDIWDNPADAISSVGHYLRAHGWSAGESVIVSARFDGEDLSLFDAGLRPSVSVQEAGASGLEPLIAVDADMMVTPLRMEQTDGMEYWLGLDNFYVITRYNHSAMYALAVWQLSEAIRATRGDTL